MRTAITRFGALAALFALTQFLGAPPRCEAADPPSQSELAAGVREYPARVVRALLTLADQPLVLRQLVDEPQLLQNPDRIQPPVSAEVAAAIRELSMTPAIIAIAAEHPEQLAELRRLYRDAPEGVEARISQLRSAYQEANRAAAEAWQRALDADPVALGEYRELMNRFCEDQRKDFDEYPTVQVKDRQYYAACPPNDPVIAFALEEGGSSNVRALIQKWADEFSPQRRDDRVLSQRSSGPAAGGSPSAGRPHAALATAPPEARSSMWSPDGTGGDRVPVILQPPADQPPAARYAYAVSEHARLWSRGQPMPTEPSVASAAPSNDLPPDNRSFVSPPPADAPVVSAPGPLDEPVVVGPTQPAYSRQSDDDDDDHRYDRPRYYDNGPTDSDTYVENNYYSNNYYDDDHYCGYPWWGSIGFYYSSWYPGYYGYGGCYPGYYNYACASPLFSSCYPYLYASPRVCNSAYYRGGGCGGYFYGGYGRYGANVAYGYRGGSAHVDHRGGGYGNYYGGGRAAGFSGSGGLGGPRQFSSARDQLQWAGRVAGQTGGRGRTPTIGRSSSPGVGAPTIDNTTGGIAGAGPMRVPTQNSGRIGGGRSIGSGPIDNIGGPTRERTPSTLGGRSGGSGPLLGARPSVSQSPIGAGQPRGGATSPFRSAQPLSGKSGTIRSSRPDGAAGAALSPSRAGSSSPVRSFGSSPSRGSGQSFRSSPAIRSGGGSAIRAPSAGAGSRAGASGFRGGSPSGFRSGGGSMMRSGGGSAIRSGGGGGMRGGGGGRR